MKKIFNFLLPLICIICGIAITLLGIQEYKSRQLYLKNTGEIILIDSEYNHARESYDYTVIVKHTVDGQDYEAQLNEYSSSMKVGKQIEILYNPENPAEILSASPFGNILMIGLGVLCIPLGVYLFIKRRA